MGNLLRKIKNSAKKVSLAHNAADALKKTDTGRQIVNSVKKVSLAHNVAKVVQPLVAANNPSNPITPNTRVIPNDWVLKNNVVIAEIGSSVSLGPWPKTGGSWIWTGPNGFSSSNREITISPLSHSHYGEYVAQYQSPTGDVSKMSFFVRNPVSSTIEPTTANTTVEQATAAPTVVESDSSSPFDNSRQIIGDPSVWSGDDYSPSYANQIEQSGSYTDEVLPDIQSVTAGIDSNPKLLVIGVLAVLAVGYFLFFHKKSK